MSIEELFNNFKKNQFLVPKNPNNGSENTSKLDDLVNIFKAANTGIQNNSSDFAISQDEIDALKLVNEEQASYLQEMYDKDADEELNINEYILKASGFNGDEKRIRQDGQGRFLIQPGQIGEDEDQWTVEDSSLWDIAETCYDVDTIAKMLGGDINKDEIILKITEAIASEINPSTGEAQMTSKYGLLPFKSNEPIYLPSIDKIGELLGVVETLNSETYMDEILGAEGLPEATETEAPQVLSQETYDKDYQKLLESTRTYKEIKEFNEKYKDDGLNSFEANIVATAEIDSIQGMVSGAIKETIFSEGEEGITEKTDFVNSIIAAAEEKFGESDELSEIKTTLLSQINGVEEAQATEAAQASALSEEWLKEQYGADSEAAYKDITENKLYSEFDDESIAAFNKVYGSYEFEILTATTFEEDEGLDSIAEKLSYSYYKIYDSSLNKEDKTEKIGKIAESYVNKFEIDELISLDEELCSYKDLGDDAHVFIDMVHDYEFHAIYGGDGVVKYSEIIEFNEKYNAKMPSFYTESITVAKDGGATGKIEDVEWLLNGFINEGITFDENSETSDEEQKIELITGIAIAAHQGGYSKDEVESLIAEIKDSYKEDPELTEIYNNVLNNFQTYLAESETPSEPPTTEEGWIEDLESLKGTTDRNLVVNHVIEAMKAGVKTDKIEESLGIDFDDQNDTTAQQIVMELTNIIQKTDVLKDVEPGPAASIAALLAKLDSSAYTPAQIERVIGVELGDANPEFTQEIIRHLQEIDEDLAIAFVEYISPKK